MKVFLNIIYDQKSVDLKTSCSIGSEFEFSGKQNLSCKNEQHADPGGGNHFNYKIKKTSKLKPFKKNQVAMMQQGKYKNIHRIGCPAHSIC